MYKYKVINYVRNDKLKRVGYSRFSLREMLAKMSKLQTADGPRPQQVDCSKDVENLDLVALPTRCEQGTARGPGVRVRWTCCWHA